jgi:ABC-type phosphate transport system ATPase subunit
MGPPKCGKSTLIRSLVKVYTNHNLTEIVGPITVVAAKTRRVTFIECPNSTTAMIDCAKVADLVLLCVDAKFGFEMEVSAGSVATCKKTISLRELRAKREESMLEKALAVASLEPSVRRLMLLYSISQPPLLVASLIADI